MSKVLIVGSGIAGSVAARTLAEKGRDVLLLERRNHVGGNAYDERDDAGITVQRHGPHIFHTNDKKIWDFLSRFTAWRHYQHRVLAFVHGRFVPVPINIDTVNSLYGFRHDADSIEAFYASRRTPIAEPQTLRDAVVARVGEDLFALIFENYTRKQWGLDARELPAALAGRVPTRANRDDRYFTDRYQGMPEKGYTPLFAALLDHPRIEVRLNTPYAGAAAAEKRLTTLYTGGIDEFFGCRFGPLPYRSLRLEFKTYDYERHQPAAVVNYPNDYDFTRITEFKHWTGEVSAKTTVLFEYPGSEGEPYYPMPTPEARALYARYAEEARKTDRLHFLGRLGGYRYLNLDQAALEAMTLAETLS